MIDCAFCLSVKLSLHGPLLLTLLGTSHTLHTKMSVCLWSCELVQNLFLCHIMVKALRHPGGGIKAAFAWPFLLDNTQDSDGGPRMQRAYFVLMYSVLMYWWWRMQQMYFVLTGNWCIVPRMPLTAVFGRQPHSGGEEKGTTRECSHTHIPTQSQDVKGVGMGNVLCSENQHTGLMHLG